MNVLRLGFQIERSEIYGPGIRSVYWLQGCTLACKGCWNTQFWPSKGGDLIDVDRLLSELSRRQDIEGITLLGGEPLQQAQQVEQLMMGCKKMGLTVFLYTGYEMHELDPTMKRCVDLADIVVMGRFVQALRNTNLRWRGSENQTLLVRNSKYKFMKFADQNEVEIHLDTSGGLSVVGYGNSQLLEIVGLNQHDGTEEENHRRSAKKEGSETLIS